MDNEIDSIPFDDFAEQTIAALNWDDNKLLQLAIPKMRIEGIAELVTFKVNAKEWAAAYPGDTPFDELKAAGDTMLSCRLKTINVCESLIIDRNDWSIKICFCQPMSLYLKQTLQGLNVAPVLPASSYGF